MELYEKRSYDHVVIIVHRRSSQSESDLRFGSRLALTYICQMNWVNS